MQSKTKKLQRIYAIFWFLLAYIIAALVFWYVELSRQNKLLNEIRMHEVSVNHPDFPEQKAAIEDAKRRKTMQYTGEGIIFFLVIIAGAGFIFRAVRRQLRQSVQQQNFMIGITHELKTPIAVSQLNLETLRKRKLDEVTQQKLIKATLDETIRMNTLCNNMLLSSQIDAGGYRLTNEDINFSELVRESISDFANRFPEKKIQATIEEEVFVSGDNLLLKIAVNNLIDNSIKYSPRDTPVLITLSNRNNHIILTIRDNGIGIRPEDKPRIFEKFYRGGDEATKAAKGTGLGLYLTYRVIKAHQGKINIEDNIPKGTAFIVQLNNSITPP